VGDQGVVKKSTKDAQLTVRVPQAIKDELEKRAVDEERSVSFVVVKILAEALKTGQSK
jgi:hypothetical protein